MKSVNNIESFTQVMAVVLTERFISGDINEVCEIIDPYIDAYAALNDHTEQRESMMYGIHLAFWIMLDERLKLPTDPLIFSKLMAKCFEYGDKEDKTGERIFAELVNQFDNLSKEQMEWTINLTHLKLVNSNLVLSCLWSLLQIWDYLQKQVDFQQSLQRESTL